MPSPLPAFLRVDTDPYHFDDNGVPELAFSEDQDSAHAYRRRATKPPAIDSASDDTIKPTYQHLELWVSTMVQAMFNLDGTLESPTHPSYKMFRHGSKTALTGYEVEATCRVLFDIVIDRCYFGFRGPTKDNLALKPSEGHTDDRDGNCLKRIENVTAALRFSKCICRDVMYEDYNCIKLANAPLSYLGQKKKAKTRQDIKIQAPDIGAELHRKTHVAAVENSIDQQVGELPNNTSVDFTLFNFDAPMDIGETFKFYAPNLVVGFGRTVDYDSDETIDASETFAGAQNRLNPIPFSSSISGRTPQPDHLDIQRSVPSNILAQRSVNALLKPGRRQLFSSDPTRAQVGHTTKNTNQVYRFVTEEYAPALKVPDSEIPIHDRHATPRNVAHHLE
jgi:hypothetical protein